MPTKKELEQEVKALKRKLKETKEELDEKETELVSSKSKISKQDLKINKQDLKINKQDHKINKQDHLLQRLKDKVECPVCLEMPRSGPVSVCPNGHVVCETCKRKLRNSCPTCRSAMGSGKSLLAGTIVENVDHKCKFLDCDEAFTPEDIEDHEVSCPHRTVNCPDVACPVKVPLSKLVDHLINSEICSTCTFPTETGGNWNTVYCYSSVSDFAYLRWPMDIYSYSGESVAVFPYKSRGQYYFVIVMFASETECAKYKFELIVHPTRQVRDLDSEDTVKFQGSPLSIDLKKEDLNIFSASEQSMSSIMKKSSDKSRFWLSFKITKKEDI